MSKVHKIVYNNCYGGFGLNSFGQTKFVEECAKKYNFEIIETKIIDDYVSNVLFKIKNEKDLPNFFHKRSDNFYIISDDDIPRHLSILINLIEKFGAEKVQSEFAKLEIKEISTPIYRIKEYDGLEKIEEIHIDSGIYCICNQDLI